MTMQLATVHKILIASAIGWSAAYAAYSLYQQFWLGAALATVAGATLAFYLLRFVRAERRTAPPPESGRSR
jgi:hypothetical protein